jgi:hypothetical protein
MACVVNMRPTRMGMLVRSILMRHRVMSLCVSHMLVGGSLRRGGFAVVMRGYFWCFRHVHVVSIMGCLGHRWRIMSVMIVMIMFTVFMLTMSMPNRFMPIVSLLTVFMLTVFMLTVFMWLNVVPLCFVLCVI